MLLLRRDDAYAYLHKFIASEVPLGEVKSLPKDYFAYSDNLRIVAWKSLTRQAGRLNPDRWIEVKRAVSTNLTTASAP